MNITPLVASNFHELVLGQPAGVRLLVVFVDDERKMKLINHFAVAVKPFSRSVNVKHFLRSVSVKLFRFIRAVCVTSLN